MDPDTGDVFTRPAPRRALGSRAREWVVWFGPGRLVVTAVSVVAIALGGYWLLRSPQPPVEAGLPRAVAVTTGPPAATIMSATPVADTIVVHVAGAVAAPGLYHLPKGARADDAVAAAGGPAASANLDALNLATPLSDGMRVFVPARGESAAPEATVEAAPTGPLNLNTATAAQLDVLPGVGPSTAAAIVAYRESHGPFTAVDELADVRGIGPAKLDALRGLVSV